MAKTDENRPLLPECRDYIEAHLSEELDLEALAAHFGYAYSSFRRLFRQSSGYSIHNYIRLQRLFRAARLLREGRDTAEAVETGGFETLSGFNKAFMSEFGVTGSQYAASRGRILMREPEILERPELLAAGRVLGTVSGEPEREEDRGAYWLECGLSLPDEEERLQLGGGEETVGFWSGPPGLGYYRFGPVLSRPARVPRELETVRLSGGLFACFAAPEAAQPQKLLEAVRATWFFALRQWLPESSYEKERGRLSYELYQNGMCKIYVPVRQKRPDQGGTTR